MRLTEPVGDLQELPMPEEGLEPATRGIMIGALALVSTGVEAGSVGIGGVPQGWICQLGDVIRDTFPAQW
jgi:hypothetical protein